MQCIHERPLRSCKTCNAKALPRGWKRCHCRKAIPNDWVECVECSDRFRDNQVTGYEPVRREWRSIMHAVCREVNSK